MSYKIPEIWFRPSASSVEPKGDAAKIVGGITSKVAGITNIRREIHEARRRRFESAKSRVLDIAYSDVFDQIRNDLPFWLEFDEIKFDNLGLKHIERADQLDDPHIRDLRAREDLIISGFIHARDSAYLKGVAEALHTTIVFYELTMYERKTEICTLRSPWCRSFTPYSKPADAQNRIVELEKNIKLHNSVLGFLRKIYLAVVSSDDMDMDMDLDVDLDLGPDLDMDLDIFQTEQTNQPVQPINFVL